MRRLLLDGLPRADVLHLGDAALFSDLEELEQTLLTAREDLLGAVLYGNLNRMRSCDLCVILYCLDDSECSNTECITKALETYLSSISLGASFVLLNTGVYVLVPKRLQQFTDTWLSWSDYNSLSRQAWSFLHYCNIRCVPKELKIDCCKLQQTFFWQDYSLRNPLITAPFLQVFLSGVEVLEFCSGSNILSCGRLCGAGPITFLRYIISSNQSCLKHLKISGSPEIAKNVLESIADLSSMKPMYGHWSELQLYTVPLPYHLESLSVLLVKSAVSCIDLSYTERIVAILRSISTFQINLLCMVTLQDIDSCSNDVDINRMDHSEYNAPLSVLNQFLKHAASVSSTCCLHNFLPSCL